MNLDLEAVAVLGAVALATIGLLYHVAVRQPAMIRRRLDQSLAAFSRAVELRFPGREGITERVVALSLAVGRRLRLDKPGLKRLERAAVLCEIGLCAVPYRQLNDRSPDQWTDEEREKFKRHPEIGAAMIELVPSIRPIAPIVRCAAAAFNGSTGPTFPSHDAIPIESRVLHVVSDFVNIERHRGTTNAVAYLQQNAQSLYDPDVVFAFLNTLHPRQRREAHQMEKVATG